MSEGEAARAGQATTRARLNYFNYFTEIEDAFIRRRGKHLLVSPLDWSLMESWKEMGVPLHVVLRGIERAFIAAHLADSQIALARACEERRGRASEVELCEALARAASRLEELAADF